MENTTDTEKVYEVIRPFDESAIDAHAAKCGGRRLLKEIEVITDDDYKFCYLVKRPTKDFIGAVQAKTKATETDTPGIEKLMIGLVLEGDKQAYELDASIYTQLIKQIGGMLRSASSDIKKI